MIRLKAISQRRCIFRTASEPGTTAGSNRFKSKNDKIPSQRERLVYSPTRFIGHAAGIFSVLKGIPSFMFFVSWIIFRTIVESVFPFQNVKKLRFKGKKCCFKNHVLFTICHGGVSFPAHNFNTFLSVCLKQEHKTFCASELIQHFVFIRGYIAILWKKIHFSPN